MQEINIQRYADGSQIVDITNHVYPDYNGPIVLDSASDVDIIIATDEDDVDDSDDCDCDDDD